MIYTSYHPSFWRTRKALPRLPLYFQLSVSFILGLCAALLLLSSTRPSCTHSASLPLSYISNPRPLIVVAAGLPRTGSTWVYNVLRILMRKRDPNTIAGWYADLIAIWKNHKTAKYDHMKESWLEAYKSLNTSLLLKMHGPGPFKLLSRGGKLGKMADLTVITHRDLRTEVRSWVYQNWNSSIHSGGIAKTPFGDPQQWVRVAQHVLNERTQTMRSIGTGKYLDIRYEEWMGKSVNVQIDVIRTLAKGLDWHFTEQQLRDVLFEAERLQPPANGAILMYNPVNKLHSGHTRVDANDPQFQQVLERGYQAILDDFACNEFLRKMNYV